MKNTRSPNDFNYLEDLKKERLAKNENDNKVISLNSSNDLKDKNYAVMKGQIQVMEDKYNRDKKLLKYKGGYINDQELGDKMNELLINSIKNKLDIIENINN